MPKRQEVVDELDYIQLEYTPPLKTSHFRHGTCNMLTDNKARTYSGVSILMRPSLPFFLAISTKDMSLDSFKNLTNVLRKRLNIRVTQLVVFRAFVPI